MQQETSLEKPDRQASVKPINRLVGKGGCTGDGRKKKTGEGFGTGKPLQKTFNRESGIKLNLKVKRRSAAGKTGDVTGKKSRPPLKKGAPRKSKEDTVAIHRGCGMEKGPPHHRELKNCR